MLYYYMMYCRLLTYYSTIYTALTSYRSILTGSVCGRLHFMCSYCSRLITRSTSIWFAVQNYIIFIHELHAIIIYRPYSIIVLFHKVEIIIIISGAAVIEIHVVDVITLLAWSLWIHRGNLCSWRHDVTQLGVNIFYPSCLVFYEKAFLRKNRTQF